MGNDAGLTSESPNRFLGWMGRAAPAGLAVGVAAGAVVLLGG